MQEIFVHYQVVTFALTIAMGMIIGLAYDALRVIRVLLSPSRRVLFFLDLFFWVMMTLLVFLVLLASNWGETRAYVFIGLSIGGACYALLLTHICFRLMMCCAGFLLNVCRVIFKPFLCFFRLSSQKAGICQKRCQRWASSFKSRLAKIRGNFKKPRKE